MKSDEGFGLENAGWPALLVDAASVVCRANQAARKLFGPVLDGEAPRLAAIWSPENASSPERFLAECEMAPSPGVSLKLRTRDGNSVPLQTLIYSRKEGSQKFFVLQFVEGMAEPQTRQGNDTTIVHKQKLDCALQLARTVALDFNNALTTILGHTSLVLTQMEPEHRWRRSLLEVEKSAAKAAEIANDLGSFSRQEKDTRSQAAGNLNVQVQRCVEYFERNPGSEPVTWSLQLERRLLAAKFDEAKIQQALLRILENSIQSLRGPGRVNVQTRNLELTEATQDRNVRLAPGPYVSVEISDTGSGIAPEVLPRIFEPFFTTTPKPHRGLGLAWVYGIITNHGGGVAVSSKLDAGTSVRVYLPAEKTTVRETGLSADDMRGTQRLLLVDDEDMVLSLAQTILSSFGYDVLTADNGQKALDILQKERKVELVITDLVMPSMSGRELVEHIHRVAPDVKVLCTSGYIWSASQENGAGYLQKPFTAQELLLKVKQMLS